MTEPSATPPLHEIAATIVSAYVSNNRIAPCEVADLLRTVHAALTNLGLPAAPPAETAQAVPAVSVKKSITKDYLICLEDGKKFKSLRRHLSFAYGMTPDEYRQKWGLPSDYPMAAPSYSAVRSQLAKNIGLGTPAVSRLALAN